jgi:DNA-binding transcriptional ArsR family regulator
MMLPLGLTQPAISRHLKILVDAGIFTRDKARRLGRDITSSVRGSPWCARSRLPADRCKFHLT